MTTVYLADDNPVADYSHIMDSVLLGLRKELRTDLAQLSHIVWDEGESCKTEKMSKQKIGEGV